MMDAQLHGCVSAKNENGENNCGVCICFLTKYTICFDFFRNSTTYMNILCLVLLEPIKILRLPYMKSTSDEEVDKFLEAVSRRISLFCFGRVR